jgi:hypothetical protein
MSRISHQIIEARNRRSAPGMLKKSIQSQAPPPVPSFHISPSVNNEEMNARAKGRTKSARAAKLRYLG